MAADAPLPTILLVSSAERQPEGLSAALSEPLNMAVAQTKPGETVKSEGTPIGSGGAHLVIIAPDVEQPLMVSRQMRRLFSASQLLIVTRREELGRLGRMLAFLPDLSGAWIIEDAAGPERIRPILAEAAREEHGSGALGRHRGGRRPTCARTRQRRDHLGPAERTGRLRGQVRRASGEQPLLEAR